jgi:hypothetical protein
MAIQIFPRSCHFHWYTPEEEAKKIISQHVLSECERQNIFLSEHGNHNGADGILTKEAYETLKSNDTLFKIEDIQYAYLNLDSFLKYSPTCSLPSSTLKVMFEKVEKRDISHGAFIVAMILKGYLADFSISNKISKECLFRVQLLSEKGIPKRAKNKKRKLPSSSLSMVNLSTERTNLSKESNATTEIEWKFVRPNNKKY